MRDSTTILKGHTKNGDLKFCFHCIVDDPRNSTDRPHHIRTEITKAEDAGSRGS